MGNFEVKAELAERVLSSIGLVAALAVVVGALAAVVASIMIELDNRFCMAAIAGFLVTLVCAAVVCAITFFWRK